MKATFEKTVDILVKAYLNGTLNHRDCAACVVGNILGTSRWSYLFVTYTDTDNPNLHKQEFNSETKNCIVTGLELRRRRYEGVKAIELSGYTKKELARIEFVFETTPKQSDKDQWMFSGLMRVVDVLADIHGISLEAKTEAKAMFVKETL